MALLKDVTGVVKITRKTFFNPSGWLGYDQLKSQTKGIWGVLKELFIPAKPLHTETFEEALRRLNLTEADAQEAAKRYYKYAILFGLLGLLSIVYALFLLIVKGHILGFLLMLAVIFLFLAYAFRFHFYFFQIKHRKLGCSFAEWRQGKLFDDTRPSP